MIANFMINRTVFQFLEDRFADPKAILILGPRQSGKSTVLKEFASRKGGNQLFLNCDEEVTKDALQQIRSLADIRLILGNSNLVFIDEAQRVSNIGLTLKMIIDNFPGVKLIVSGSSALDLSNSLQEPLTGRKWEYLLLPLSTQELVGHTHFLAEKSQLPTRLIYGFYPDVVNHPGQEREILQFLTSSYLYKDIFSFQDIRKPELLPKLLKILASSVGSEITNHYLGKMVELNHLTIQRYLDLLEKAFVIFKLPSYSRNISNELKKSRKIYFYDNGIRNALLGNFQPIGVRQDLGPLWENFLVSERIKYLQHNRVWRQSYFWRTTQQQEIDYLEEYDGYLESYEFKWSPFKPSRLPKTFKQAYPESTFTTITPDNYYSFLHKE